MYCKSPLTMLAALPGWAWRGLTGGPTLTFLRHRAALGDMLMLTPILRALKQHRPDLRLVMTSRSPELFLHNPYLDENRDWHLMATRGTVRGLKYSYFEPRHPHHVEEMWCLLWDFMLERGLAEGERPALLGRHPEIFLTDTERARGLELLARKDRPVVVLISSGKTKPTHNREWGHDNFAALAATLAPHVDLVQISGERDLELPGGQSVRQVRTDIRSVAALIQAADAFVTQEGGLMHLARAAGARCVSIFGGTVHPQNSGYDRMVNLYAHPECSPCLGHKKNCEHLKCMTPITPRVVAGHVAALLREGGFALPDEALAAAPDAWTPPPFVDRAVLKAELASSAPFDVLVG